jgi:predicted Zn finger-like uncharacterized protein
VFTQCSTCNTVFELSAEVLRAAGGQVRCGRCGEIFNALARLAEEASAFDMGESAYEMEERADSILESVPPPSVPTEPPEAIEEDYGGSEIAQLQVLDFSQENLIDENIEDAVPESETYSDAALEFTLPPGELDRIFIESSVGIIPPFSSLGSLEPPEPEPVRPASAASELVEIEEFELPQPPAAPALPVAPVRAATAEDDFPLPDIEIISDDRAPALRVERAPRVELGAFELSEAPRRSTRSFAGWLSAAIAAALLLLGQVVHHNRESLTARGPLAPMLRALYASIGAPVGGTPNLAAFQLRQWGVTGDAEGDATLRVRASILNTTSQMQPFPLLRVTLANRYGTRIGTRDFAPNEYLGKPVARLLSPGEKVDAMLNILDPGKEAEGFEIDVCLPGGDKRIVCANDAAPSQARQ